MARLTFPATDARSVMTRPQTLADSQKHPILLQAPCQHPSYSSPLVLCRPGVFSPGWALDALGAAWPRGTAAVPAPSTGSAGRGGRPRLAGDPRNAVCLSSAVCLKGVRRIVSVLR